MSLDFAPQRRELARRRCERLARKTEDLPLLRRVDPAFFVLLGAGTLVLLLFWSIWVGAGWRGGLFDPPLVRLEPPLRPAAGDARGADAGGRLSDQIVLGLPVTGAGEAGPRHLVPSAAGVLRFDESGLPAPRLLSIEGSGSEELDGGRQPPLAADARPGGDLRADAADPRHVREGAPVPGPTKAVSGRRARAPRRRLV